MKYEPAGPDAWRWAPPPEGLRVSDDAACSRLRLGERFPPGHVGASLSGYVTMAASLGGAAYLLATGTGDAVRLFSVDYRAGVLAHRAALPTRRRLSRKRRDGGRLLRRRRRL